MMLFSRHCEERKLRGNPDRSLNETSELDCFVVSLLAMTSGTTFQYIASTDSLQLLHNRLPFYQHLSAKQKQPQLLLWD